MKPNTDVEIWKARLPHSHILTTTISSYKKAQFKLHTLNVLIAFLDRSFNETSLRKNSGFCCHQSLFIDTPQTEKVTT